MCRSSQECPSQLNCVAGSCKNPCGSKSCPSGKTCQVLNHNALCMCTKGCNTEVSICLKDRGCPSDKACLNYQCKNPCQGLSCPNNTPCIVEDHKPICKFCPDGFVVDQNYGCIKGYNYNTQYSSNNNNNINSVGKEI